jgi:hypothetical protein
VRLLFVFVGLLLATACGGNNSLRGFPESEVTAAHATPELVQSCQQRSGRLVVEIEGVLVREYPNFGRVPKDHGQRPLLVVTLESPTPNPVSAEAAVLMAPPGYQPGESVEYFRGRRILERPWRYLGHRRLTVRLLENDSTSPPEWVQAVGQIKTIAPAGALVGVNVPGAVISDGAWLIAQLDPDDLIMLVPLELDPVISALGSISDQRALRLRGVTPRQVSGAANANNPVAEIQLLAYLEPEPGCP